MSTLCTAPVGPGDARYAYGVCTWHGPVGEAGKRPSTGQPCCPECGGDLFETPTEAAFWTQVERADQLLPGYLELMRWSQGLCRPDYDTLVNEHRQAMEGQS